MTFCSSACTVFSRVGNALAGIQPWATKKGPSWRATSSLAVRLASAVTVAL